MNRFLVEHKPVSPKQKVKAYKTLLALEQGYSKSLEQENKIHRRRFNLRCVNRN